MAVPFQVEVPIGSLDAGAWEIVVSGYFRPPTKMTIHVRGSGSPVVYPPGVPTTGGRVWIGDSCFACWENTRVFFGDAAGTVGMNRSALGWMDVEVPPHPPGIVDVRIVLPDEQTFVIHHGFKFFEAAAEEPDPFVFEPLLMTSSYQGPGAAGAQWRSANAIAPIGPAVVLHEPPCAGCDRVVRSPRTIDAPSRPDGLVLHLARDARTTAAASSRARDASRQPDGPGTEMPVVGLDAFRREVVLTSIPTGPGRRAMLRVWGLLETNELVVLLGDPEDGAMTIPLYRAPGGLPFGSADVTHYLKRYLDGRRVTFRITGEMGPYWAMLTLTDEATHEVTVLAPR